MNIIDGKQLAQNLLSSMDGTLAKLVIFTTGLDAASNVYVKNKVKTLSSVGIEVDVRTIIDEPEMKNSVKNAAENEKAGIIVQLPLPKTWNKDEILKYIPGIKDVDGLSINNVGKLWSGKEPYFYPCTAQGVIHCIKSTGTELKGKTISILGRSEIVGKPLIAMLLKENATSISINSFSTKTKELCQMSDIIISAMGKAHYIDETFIGKEQILIDVGISRVDNKLQGDFHPNALTHCKYYTPVPGGVGPLTVAFLCKNVILASKLLKTC